MKFLLLGNGPYLNRGCEAIVRGTTELFDEIFNPDYELINAYFSWFDGVHDLQNSIEKDPRIQNLELGKIFVPQSPPRRNSHRWWDLQFSRLGLKDYSSYPKLAELCSGASAAFQIGGDNYTLDYGYPHRHMNLDNVVLEQGVPLFLWGASVGPFDQDKTFEKKIIKHLSRFSGLFIREKSSYDYLLKMGVPEEKLYECDDPAFFMRPKEPENFPHKDFFADEVLGVNFSPLIYKYLARPVYEQWADHCTNLLEAILDHFDMPVALIPHVTTGINSSYPLLDSTCEDQLFLHGIQRRLKSKYKGRVLCLENHYNAEETKWIISQCSWFMGARTHSTIASLSMSVPTISIAYSRKAWGLNEKMLGTKDYCIDCDEISTKNIVPMLSSLISNSQDITNELVEKNEMIKKRGDLIKRALSTVTANQN